MMGGVSDYWIDTDPFSNGMVLVVDGPMYSSDPGLRVGFDL